MNATVLTEDGEAFTRIHELTLYYCSDCGNGGGIGAQQRLFETSELTLVTFDFSDDEPIDAPICCTECGGRLTTTGRALVYVPDEAELPALVRRADFGKEEEWFLAALKDRETSGDAAGFLAAVSSDRIPLDDVSEEALTEQWGRPLSVGAYWRRLCMPVMAVDDDEAGSEIALPGLRLIVDGQRVPEGGVVDAAAVERQVAGRLFTKDGFEGVMFTPLRARWAAPIRDELARRFSLCAVDVEETRAAVLVALDQYRIEQGAAPEGRDHPYTVWLCGGELVAPLELVAVAERAALDGTTIAEAAVAAVLRRAWELAQANVALARIRKLLGPERAATVKPFAIDNIGLDGQAHGFNLESILAKGWWNPLSDEFAETIKRFLAPPPTHDQGLQVCPCGPGRPFLHLRPLDEPGGHVYRQVEDAVGNQFALISTLDCSHAIRHVSADQIEEHLGSDPDDLFARGVRQTSLRVQARALRGLDVIPFQAATPVKAIVVSCDSVASLLAHEQLGAALARAFSPRLRSRRMAAVALATNLLILLPCAPGEEPDPTWAEIATRDALADPMVPTPGYRLGFVAYLDATAKAAGSITIDWADERAPVAA